MIFLKKSSTGENKAFDALLVSPLDFHGYVIDLPPLKTEHIDGAVRFRLRTLHPGDLAETSIDYSIDTVLMRSFSRTGGSIAAFAVNNAVLETYQNQHVPLISGITIIQQSALKIEKGISLGILATADWIEVALLDDGNILASVAFDPQKDEHWSDQLANLPGFPLPESLNVFIISQNLASNNLQSISANLAQAGIVTPAMINLQQAFDSLSLKSGGIFTKKDTPSRFSRRHILEALLVLNLFAGTITVSQYANQAEIREKNLKKEYNKRKQFALEMEKIKTEISVLEGSGNASLSQRVTSPYVIISEITANLHGAWIRSLIIRDDGFQLEAEGADSLAVLNSLNTSDSFSNVSLHQAIPSPVRGELFSISGSLAHDTK